MTATPYGRGVDVRWVTAFVDRRAESFRETLDFWQAVSGCHLSPWRGANEEFATLLPDDGSDAHLRIQRTASASCGSHIDLHVKDVRSGVEDCLQLEASIVADHVGYVVLQTPGGLPFCVVAHHGERRRQRPVALGDSGPKTLLDQLSVDVDSQAFDDEVRFWAAITGWDALAARRPEFVPLARQPAMPLRIMLQRRTKPAGATGCHLDFACDDVAAATQAHSARGASVVSTHRYWTVLADPSGTHYCLTARLPETGTLATT